MMEGETTRDLWFNHKDKVSGTNQRAVLLFEWVLLIEEARFYYIWLSVTHQTSDFCHFIDFMSVTHKQTTNNDVCTSWKRLILGKREPKAKRKNQTKEKTD